MARIADRMNELVAEKVTFRTQAEVLRFFDGLELVEPGVVPVQRWRPASDLEARAKSTMWCGVARRLRLRRDVHHLRVVVACLVVLCGGGSAHATAFTSACARPWPIRS